MSVFTGPVCRVRGALFHGHLYGLSPARFPVSARVPAETLYDNMKHVVIGRDNGKPTFNVEFLHFSKHYGFTPRLCPPYSPWVKGKVERPMHYLRESFWRGYAYRSLAQANLDVAAWLEETALQRVHGTLRQQVRLRWEQEIPFLNPLPASDYDTSLKFFRKVYKDCLISFAGQNSGDSIFN